MGKFHNSILPAHQEFIKKQHLFFVSTAPLDANGHINLSAYPIGLYGFSFFDASGKLLETLKVSVHR